MQFPLYLRCRQTGEHKPSWPPRTHQDPRLPGTSESRCGDAESHDPKGAGSKPGSGHGSLLYSSGPDGFSRTAAPESGESFFQKRIHQFRKHQQPRPPLFFGNFGMGASQIPVNQGVSHVRQLPGQEDEVICRVSQNLGVTGIAWLCCDVTSMSRDGLMRRCPMVGMNGASASSTPEK